MRMRTCRKNSDLQRFRQKAILEMRLQKLTGLEREKIELEYRELVKKVEELKSILEIRGKRMQIIKDEVLEMKDRYSDDRRTTILEGSADIETEDMIADEEMVVTISCEGYIKRLPIRTYRKQQRGGKGLSGSNLKEEDFIESIFVASTHAFILFFTDLGQCHWLKVHRIPKVGRLARGKAIVNLLQLERNERIEAYVTVRDFELPNFVTIVTKNGIIKKTALAAFSHPRTGGIIAIKLIKGDELIDVKQTNGDQDIFLGARKGNAIRFNEKDVRAMGRTSRGVIGIRMTADDEVVGMEVLSDNNSILTVSENGFGKRTEILEYRVQSRGGKGIINLKTTPKIGLVTRIKQVTGDEDIMLISNTGNIIRLGVNEVSLLHRSTQGVKLIDLDDEETLVGLARAEREEPDMGEELSAGEESETFDF